MYLQALVFVFCIMYFCSCIFIFAGPCVWICIYTFPFRPFCSYLYLYWYLHALVIVFMFSTKFAEPVYIYLFAGPCEAEMWNLVTSFGAHRLGLRELHHHTPGVRDHHHHRHRHQLHHHHHHRHHHLHLHHHWLVEMTPPPIVLCALALLIIVLIARLIGSDCHHHHHHCHGWTRKWW